MTPRSASRGTTNAEGRTPVQRPEAESTDEGRGGEPAGQLHVGPTASQVSQDHPHHESEKIRLEEDQDQYCIDDPASAVRTEEAGRSKHQEGAEELYPHRPEDRVIRGVALQERSEQGLVGRNQKMAVKFEGGSLWSAGLCEGRCGPNFEAGKNPVKK